MQSEKTVRSFYVVEWKSMYTNSWVLLQGWSYGGGWEDDATRIDLEFESETAAQRYASHDCYGRTVRIVKVVQTIEREVGDSYEA